MSLKLLQELLSMNKAPKDKAAKKQYDFERMLSGELTPEKYNKMHKTNAKLRKASKVLEKKGGSTAWVIVHTNNKLILGKRSGTSNNPNQWNFFGGGVDAGESAADAAVRELGEEVGLKASASDLKLVAKIGDATYFSYKVGSAGSMRTTNEISKITTFKLVDLPDNLHFKTQNFFDQLDALL